MAKYGDENGKNNGMGRTMEFAGKNALNENFGGGHYSSIATETQRWQQFCQFARDNDIKDTRNVTTEIIKEYADKLNNGDKAGKTIQNYISTVNTVMSVLQSKWEKISPSSLSTKSVTNIRQSVPTGLNKATIAKTQEKLEENGLNRSSAVIGLARHSGMRLEEAIKANLPRLEQEAKINKTINIVDGTKGGRTKERLIPVTPDLQKALDKAVQFSPRGSKNLIAPDETFKNAKSTITGSSARKIMKESGINNFKDLRASYACDVYKEKSGHDAPVIQGKRSANKTEDLIARAEVSYLLGHGREDIAASYIGSSR